MWLGWEALIKLAGAISLKKWDDVGEGGMGGMGHGKEELWNNVIKGKHSQSQRKKSEDSVRKGGRLTGKRHMQACTYVDSLVSERWDTDLVTERQ